MNCLVIVLGGHMPGNMGYVLIAIIGFLVKIACQC